MIPRLDTLRMRDGHAERLTVSGNWIYAHPNDVWREYLRFLTSGDEKLTEDEVKRARALARQMGERWWRENVLHACCVLYGYLT